MAATEKRSTIRELAPGKRRAPTQRGFRRLPMTPQDKLRELECDWATVDRHILAHPERHEAHEVVCAQKRIERLDGK